MIYHPPLLYMRKVGPFLFLTYFIFQIELHICIGKYFIRTIFIERAKNYIKRISTIYMGCIRIGLLTGS